MKSSSVIYKPPSRHCPGQNTGHYERSEGAADVEHAAADPPPGAQQAGRTQSRSPPQDGTGNNYFYMSVVKVNFSFY